MCDIVSFEKVLTMSVPKGIKYKTSTSTGQNGVSSGQRVRIRKADTTDRDLGLSMQ